MSDAIDVFAFNVRFGDAILVRVPDKDRVGGGTTVRHILIDVGNTLAAAKPADEPMPAERGGADDVLPPAVDQILAVLGGATLDLYVMSHEHLDHVQGLPYAEGHPTTPVPPPGPKLRDVLKPKFVWMSASAEGDAYYATHPDARRQFDRRNQAFSAIHTHLWAMPSAQMATLAPLLLNNNAAFTGPCVAWLKTLAPDGQTPAYLHRLVTPAALAACHPFEEATFEIWAPEEDTSDYYGALKPMALGAASDPSPLSPPNPGPRLVPPPGVDATAFLNLVDLRRRGVAENLLAIDKSANNSSLVFCLKWRGLKLLFPGDAEQRSWATMKKQNVLTAVDFLKVAHHGSANGTPDADVLDLILPIGAPAAVKAKKVALVSTWDHTYGGIPNDPTDTKLRDRCGTLVSTLDDRTQPFVKVTLPAP